MTRNILLPALGSLVLGLAPSAVAHDDGRLHVHGNGAAIHADEAARAPGRALALFARVPAPVWGVASLAVAASLLRRRRRTALRGA
jgi:hypothetical protein